MSDEDCPNYDDVKELAKELGRPAATLYVLSSDNDPFFITPGREAEAKWFKKIWQRFHCRPGAHIRRIHYMLVSQDPKVMMLNGQPYVNTTNCAAYLNAASKDARYLGLIGLRDVIDQRNEEARIYLSNTDETSASIDLYGGLQECVPPKIEALHLGIEPPVIPQRYHVEIWFEKSTMNDIILPIARRYGVNVVTGLGELSLTRCVNLVDRAVASDKPVRIIYGSDFDAGGASMPVAVARKIEWVVRHEGHDLNIQVRPIVLTHDQCIAYRLPRTPFKDTERRADAFEERFGEGMTELDALEALHPGELARILETEIQRYYDADLDDRIGGVVDEVQTDLDDINAKIKRQHAKALKSLEVERKKVLAAISDFEKKAAPVLREIEGDLEDEAPRVHHYEWPDADDGDEDDDPLFDSTRDYVEQVDRYKEHQGKPTERQTAEVEKVCANPKCGKPFTATRSDAQYCSRKCRTAAGSKGRK